MLPRLIAGLLGVFHIVSGLYMLTAPDAWFAAVPGVTATGPFNAHFVMDVGGAFLGGGLAFLAFAWRPKLKLLALGSSGFFVVHALAHLANLAHGHTDYAAGDLTVIVTSFVGLAVCWPRKGEL